MLPMKSFTPGTHVVADVLITADATKGVDARVRKVMVKAVAVAMAVDVIDVITRLTHYTRRQR